MLTSPIFRHAKPNVKPIVTALPTSPVRFKDTLFSTSVAHAPMNLGLFDVITAGGRVLDRVGNVNGPEYRQQDGMLVCTIPGEYILRVYEDVSAQDATTVRIENSEFSDGSRGVMGVKFWPEILSQPEGGAARLSQDGDGIAIMVPLEGRYAFSYRLRNYLGQVSEPACVYVTVIA